MLFYDNFERICRMRGTTPSGAVVAIGKNKTTAGNWKRNNTIPSEDILYKLADHLGCSVSDFFASEETLKALEGKLFLDSFMKAHGDEKPNPEDITKGRSLLQVLTESVEEEENDEEPDEDFDTVESRYRDEFGYDNDFDTFVEIYRRCTRSQRYELMSIICKFDEDNLR